MSVALVIQHAKQMSHIMSPVACLAVPFLSTLPHKGQDFQENVIEHKMCVLIFSAIFSDFFFHFEKNSARYYHKCTWNVMESTRYSCKILNKLKISPTTTNFMKNCTVGADLFHVDGKTGGLTDT